MKIPLHLLSLFLLATICPLDAQEIPPQLPLFEAAKVADATLKEMNLPQEYFIRSVVLSPSQEDPKSLIYEVRFEPPGRRVIRRDDAPTDSTDPESIKYKVIIVSMDGKTTVQEKEFMQTRTIQRRVVP